MVNFVKTDIVVLPYPFSDLKSNKKRPVLVIKKSSYDDLIVIPFTSKIDNHNKLLYKVNEQMVIGSKFAKESSLILDKIFTISSSLVLSKHGKLNREIFDDVLNKVAKYLKE